MLYVVPGEVPEIPQQKCLYIGKISIIRMHAVKPVLSGYSIKTKQSP